MEEKEKKEKKCGKFEDWEVESAADIIIRAEQIKLNKDLMKYVVPLLEDKKKASENALTPAEILYGKKEDNTDKDKEEEDGKN